MVIDLAKSAKILAKNRDKFTAANLANSNPNTTSYKVTFQDWTNQIWIKINLMSDKWLDSEIT